MSETQNSAEAEPVITGPQYSDFWGLGDDASRRSWLYTVVLQEGGWPAIVRGLEKTAPILDAIGSRRTCMLSTPGGLDAGNQNQFTQLARARKEYGESFHVGFLKALESIRNMGFACWIYLGKPDDFIDGESAEEYAKRSWVYDIDPQHPIWIDTGATLPEDSFGARLAELLRGQGYTVGGEGCPGIKFVPRSPPVLDEDTAKYAGQFPVIMQDDDPHWSYLRREFQSAPFTLLQHRAGTAHERLAAALSYNRVHPEDVICSGLFLDWAVGDARPFISAWSARR